jgi:hypothetical protein
MTTYSAARRAGAVALLILTGWSAYYMVQTQEGPWGPAGLRGTLTVTECMTEHGGGADPPTMTCTGVFTSGPATTTGVQLDIDHVGEWTRGETLPVLLPPGSHTAHQPGGHTWLIRLGFCLLLLGAAVSMFGSAAAPRWARRIQATGGIVVASAFLAPPLALLLYWVI